MIKLYSYSLSILCACLFVMTNPVQAAVQCSGFDVTFTSVTLTGVGNGTITYDVTIRNAGTTTLTFSKLTLANYTSNDNVYDGSDASAGSAVFSTVTSGTSLAAGQELTTSYHASYSGSIKDIPYLILQLSYQDTECDATNNQIVACVRPNPVLNDIAISYLEENVGQYYAAIQNTGGDTLFLSKTILQNYVSVDNTLGGGDVGAGGSILNYGAKQYLLANESFVISNFDFNAANLSNYSYVIASLYYNTTACSAGNQVVKALVVVTDMEGRQEALTNTVVWDMNSTSFITKDNGTWSSNLTYQFFDASGRLLAQGKTIPGQRVHLEQGSGLGILLVTDERNSCSQKIIR